MIRYVIFRLYVYFCNLVISRVIINTLLCNPILVIVKNSSRHSRGSIELRKKNLYVFFLFFFSPIRITIVAQFTTH